MRHTVLHRLFALTLCTVFVAALSAPTTADARARKGKKNNTVQSTGGETTAERDRRLMRECKGRPNAGACLGYTR